MSFVLISGDNVKALINRHIFVSGQKKSVAEKAKILEKLFKFAVVCLHPSFFKLSIFLQSEQSMQELFLQSGRWRSEEMFKTYQRT